jgi:hypothetical protein
LGTNLLPSPKKSSAMSKVRQFFGSLENDIINYSKTTSQVQLELKLHPFEKSLATYVQLKLDIYKQAATMAKNATDSANSALTNCKACAQASNQICQSATGPQTVQPLIQLVQYIQQVIFDTQQTADAAIQSIYTAASSYGCPPATGICLSPLLQPAQPSASSINPSPNATTATSLTQKIIENCNNAIGKSQTSVQELNKIIQSQVNLPSTLPQISNTLSDATIAAQQTSYAAQQAVNVAQQLVQQIYNEYLLGARANENLREADEALKKGQVQCAWGHYYEAELFGYHLLDEPSIRTHALSMLYDQRSSLDEDEKKTVQALLGTARANDGGWELKPDLKMEEVVAARRTVQEHYNTRYTELSMILRQLQILGFIALLLMIVLIPVLVNSPTTTLSLANFKADNFTASNVVTSNLTTANFTGSNINALNVQASNVISASNAYFLLAIAIFGALGGTFSAMISLSNSSTGDVPERLVNSWLTIAKPIVGAIGALAIFVLLLGGIIQALSLTNYLIFAMAFASGFSERIVFGAISKIDSSGTK